MTTRKVLGLLCQHFYPEMVSTGLHMTELATGLAEKGWHLQVYCAASQARQVGEPDSYRGVNISRVKPWGRHGSALVARLAFALTYVVGTAWRVMRDRARLAGLIVSTNPPFVGLIALVMRRIFRLPYVLIVYDVYPDVAVRLGVLRAGSLAERLWRTVTEKILRGASCIVVIGRDMEEAIARKLSGSDVPMVLIPNWSNETVVSPVARENNTFAREYGLDGRIVVQYAGNMGRTHNVEALLEAAALLRDRTDVTFQFVGDGAKRAHLESMAQERKLKNVQFLPYQPYERLAEMLSAANLSVVVLEKGFEGLSVPSKTYGIMAAGVPVIGLLDPDSEIGRTIIENQCGVVLSSANAASMAEVIRERIRKPDLFAQLGQNARRAFLDKYSLSRAVEHYDQVLRRIFSEYQAAQN